MSDNEDDNVIPLNAPRVRDEHGEPIIRVVAEIRANTAEHAIRRAYEGETVYAEMLESEFKEYEDFKERDQRWFDFATTLVWEQLKREAGKS